MRAPARDPNPNPDPNTNPNPNPKLAPKKAACELLLATGTLSALLFLLPGLPLTIELRAFGCVEGTP
jgi:hypothetical protein